MKDDSFLSIAHVQLQVYRTDIIFNSSINIQLLPQFFNSSVQSDGVNLLSVRKQKRAP